MGNDSEGLENNTNASNTNSEREQIKKTDTVKRFLHTLPKLPSHYCRHRIYEQDTKSNDWPVASGWLFNDVYNGENISLFKPKKECDLCCTGKVGNISEYRYKKHIQQVLDRDEKSKENELTK